MWNRNMRRICSFCDRYYTPHTGDTRENACQNCCKELGDVKSGLAERTLKSLHDKFPKES